jgi:hypothetical protein
MMVWLNGASGVGKTTVSRELARALSGARIFDPELVGQMLRAILEEPIDDFQDWPAWRKAGRRDRPRAAQAVPVHGDRADGTAGATGPHPDGSATRRSSSTRPGSPRPTWRDAWRTW